MKNIFVCYNYLTLYKAIYNIRHYQQGNKNVIIYRNLVSKLPSNTKKYFNVTEFMIGNSGVSSIFPKKYINEFRKISLTKKISSFIKREVSGDEPANLFVYKDNEKIESTIIETFKYVTRGKGKVILTEEGIGLYGELVHTKRKIGLLSMLAQRLLGLSEFSLKKYPQGYNPNVDKVVCSNRDQFNKIKGRKELTIYEQKNIFNKENVEYFVKDILGINHLDYELYSKLNYVYLTQPLKDINVSIDEEKKILESLSINSCEGILIKRHPRDKLERDFGVNSETHELKGRLNNIPFECFFPFMGNPIMLSCNSSACFNILADNPNANVILLHKIMKRKVSNNVIERIKHHGVYIPNDLEELNKVVKELLRT
ncbi:polysialyltransferase family glycosyltransferase [Oceanobacillus alkalisoli]|uniref:polysialyltransferase family glycosyltransferase n=1 Tax=Oceanobacillus alkalisoli TaxID=2925113 RepID=UPI001EE40626|nr:polysialyltransferase family glycosyltransferase [Oceanobacillus alkalisoli]MCG5102600.1 hypothetical protein [Oceanobacillus alkalisoli]